ncbi:hypothetical protein RQP46_008317 [Phenoliferia psychrophenolica]
MSPIAITESIAPTPTSRPKAVLKAWKPVATSAVVKKIRNPIREIIAGIDLGGAAATGAKPFLNLGLGDPSVYGNFPPPKEALDAIEESLRSGKSDGYPDSVGYAVAREAVANYFDEGEGGAWRVKKEDVVMTHGASGALEMAFSVLADETKNVLFPKPLFTAYETMITATGASIRYYDLLPESNWEVDLNFYAGMAWTVSGPRPASADAVRVQGKFNRGVFTPYASVAGTSPVVILGAVSKRWLAPGWRLGWVILHDPLNVLAEVREGLGKWAFRIQGPNSTMQRALPALLANTPEAFFTHAMDDLADVGQQLFDRLAKIPGLQPLLPQGAMYLMCGGLTTANFPAFANDVELVRALLSEEKMLILPGSCFRLEGFLRFVTTVPLPTLMEACDRLEAFCRRHAA